MGPIGFKSNIGARIRGKNDKKMGVRINVVKSSRPNHPLLLNFEFHYNILKLVVFLRIFILMDVVILLVISPPGLLVTKIVLMNHKYW